MLFRSDVVAVSKIKRHMSREINQIGGVDTGERDFPDRVAFHHNGVPVDNDAAHVITHKSQSGTVDSCVSFAAPAVLNSKIGFGVMEHILPEPGVESAGLATSVGVEPGVRSAGLAMSVGVEKGESIRICGIAADERIIVRKQQRDSGNISADSLCCFDFLPSVPGPAQSRHMAADRKSVV